MASLVLLPCCTKEDKGNSESSEKTQKIAIPFSLSVNDVAPTTKMTNDIVQGTSPVVFRGIDELNIIPFIITGAEVSSLNKRSGSNLYLPQHSLPADTFGDDSNEGAFAGLVNTSNSHLFRDVPIPIKTNAVVVYAKALDEDMAVVSGADEIAYNKRNGVLNHTDLLEPEYLSAVSFDLEPYAGSGTAEETDYKTWRKGLVDYLNAILKVKVENKKNNVVLGTYTFNKPDSWNNHSVLLEALNNFTNKGVLMTGSHESLDQLLTQLYRAVYTYSVKEENSQGYNEGTYYYVYELSKAILTKIDNSNYVTRSGSGTGAKIALKNKSPESFGMPYGTFPLLFREGSRDFTYEIESPGGIGTVDFKDFCYPPALWYYSNSRIVTTADEDVKTKYKSSTGTWDKILALYESTFVQSDCKGAAIINPLQYAVGRMDVKINKTTSQKLGDYRGSNKVAVSGTSYPLTGIIVSDQKPVDFGFNPVSNGKNRYIYDSDVYDGTAPRAYISYDIASSTVSTLVLQSQDAENVHFALEFINNSKSTFYGANNCAVYPGCHFYLAGMLDYSKATNTTGETLPGVFTKDHTTEVSISISDLKNAYTVVPDLQDPRLVIGVEADLEWKMVTPITVVIK